METYATLSWQQAYSGPFATGALRLNFPTLQADVMYMGVTQVGTGTATVLYPSYCYTNWTFSDWSGSSHSFNGFRDCDAARGDFTTNFWLTSREASDDSGYRIDLTSPSDPQVIGPNGDVYHFPAYTPSANGYVALGIYSKPFARMVDSNGNTTTFDFSSRVLTDTVGRHIQYDGLGGISWQFQSSPSAAPITASVTISQSNSGEEVPFDTGANASCRAKDPSVYNGNAAKAAGWPGPMVQGPVAPTVYSWNKTTLNLPDGSFYELTSDRNNRLVKVRYPSGGYHSYDYGSPASINEDDGDILCNRPRVVVTAKHECSRADGSCSPSTPATLTSCPAGVISGGEATTCYVGNSNQYGYLSLDVTSPLGEKTAYTFTAPNQQPGGSPGVPGHFDAPQETSHTIYAANSSLVLQKVESLFVTPTNCPMVNTPYGSVQDGEWCGAVPAGNTTTLYSAQGQPAGASEHDITLQYPSSELSTQDLDFSGNLIRSSSRVFATGGIYNATGTSGTLYHVLDRVISSTTSEAATASSITHTNTLDGNGNVTQVSTSATRASSTTSKTPRNTAGEITGYSDPMQSAGAHSGSTQYSYDPQGIPNCPATNGPGLPTKVTNALNQSILYSFDAVGQLACVQDANNQVTRYSHDALGRVTAVDYPDGGRQSANYTATAPLTVSMSMTGGASTEVVQDGLGRTTQRKLFAPEGTICTEQFYDADGNVSAVNDPILGCRGSVAANGSMQMQYDALGREHVRTNQDASTQHLDYDGYSIAFTDEASHATRRTSDAAGRIVSVQEATGAKTRYSYDGFDNLTGVLQEGVAGETSRSRSFTYDGLSRLVTSTNPETGPICYGIRDGQGCHGGYDLNGNLLNKSNLRGVITSYIYDPLNRLTQKSYSGYSDMQTVHYRYDTDGGWGGSQSNIIGRLSQMWTERDTRHFLVSPGAPCNPNSSATANYHPDYGNPAYCQYTDYLFYYDAMGRLTQEAFATPSEAGWTAHFASTLYDLAGNPTTVTYPNGWQVTHEYDGAGRLHLVYAGTPASKGQQYYAVPSFFPNGQPSQAHYGLNSTENFQLNSRRQICRHTLKWNGQLTMDREYFYGTSNTQGEGCNDIATNNGDIREINDNLNSGASQSFKYDALNRLTAWSSSSFAGSARNWSFGYDSFGNMIQNNAPTPTDAHAIFDEKNRIKPSVARCLPQGVSSGVGQVDIYDAAGNPYCSGDSTAMEASQYIWDGANRLSSFWTQWHNNIALTSVYSYGPDDQRVRADQVDGAGASQSWREYTNFNGEMLAEKDQNDQWTNYVYAGGRRVAKVTQQEYAIRMAGNIAYPHSTGYMVPNAAAGYVIRSGDILRVRERQTGAIEGGIVVFTQEGGNNGAIADQDGQIAGADTIRGAWHLRNIPLNSLAGQTVNRVQFGGGTGMQHQAGPYTVEFAEISLTSADGSVQTIYNGISATPLAHVEDTTPSVAVSQGAADGTGVHYFAADHLGTAQMELSSGGYPLWKGEFAPFGQQLGSNLTSNRYKFTGKERDAESGLDYFGARFYASTTGRFMSPDPSGLLFQKPEDPQSWNLYAYARNNPLINVDPTGLDCVYANDAGNGVESIDHSSNLGECGQNGGSWVPGYANENWAHFNQNTGQFQVASLNNNGSLTANYTTFGAGDRLSWSGDETICGNCSGFSQTGAQGLADQLVGNSTIGGYLSFLAGRELQLSTFSQIAYGPLDYTKNNWAGPGGFGAPSGEGDWRASVHDYNFYSNGITINSYFNPSLSPATSRALIQSNNFLMQTGGYQGAKEKIFFGVVNAFQWATHLF